MTAERIHPFVRYVRYVEIGRMQRYRNVRAYDSRLFYAVCGEGWIEAEGQKYPMRRGSLMILKSGLRYSLGSEAGKSVTYIAVNFDFTHDHSNLKNIIPLCSAKSFDENRILDREAFVDLPALNLPYYRTEMQSVEATLYEMDHHSAFRHPKLCEWELSHAMSEVLLAALKKEEPARKDKSSDPSYEILNYIHAHFSEPLTNEQIGKTFGRHPNYAGALVKRATGLGLHQYLLSVRISNAARLLEKSTESIGAIALMCGFDDPNHFTRTFKKMNGMTPHEYRKQH